MRELIDEYLEYFKQGLSAENLYFIMEHDYELYLMKKYGLVSSNVETNIKSLEDAKIKFKALKKAYREYRFPGYKFILRIENKNTTLD